MKKRTVAGLSAALTLALGAFTGAALAGNGNDGTPPGNSGNAPGQVKQAADQPATAPQPAAPQPQAAPQEAAPKAHAAPSHAAHQSSPATSHSSLPGAKPTPHATHDTHETADSGKTKKYGNGNTAGNIVTSRGGAGSTMLHGPGNSQPHKVLACGKRHEVDVHAIKSYGADCAKKQEAVQQVRQHEEAAPAKVYICHATGSATNPFVLIHVSTNALPAHTAHQDGRDVVLGATAGACPTATQVHTTELQQAAPVLVPATISGNVAGTQQTQRNTTVAPAVAAVAPATATAAPQGGVLGVQAVLKPKTAPHGVLGTTRTVATSTLPFTGIELWIFVLVAGAVTAAGVTLRKAGRGTL